MSRHLKVKLRARQVGAGVSKGQSFWCPVSRSGLPESRQWRLQMELALGPLLLQAASAPCSGSPVTAEDPPRPHRTTPSSLSPSVTFLDALAMAGSAGRSLPAALWVQQGCRPLRFISKTSKALCVLPQHHREKQTLPSLLGVCTSASSPGCAHGRVWVCAWAHTSVPGCGSGQPPPGNTPEGRWCEVGAHAPVVRNPGGF